MSEAADDECTPLLKQDVGKEGDYSTVEIKGSKSRQVEVGVVVYVVRTESPLSHLCTQLSELCVVGEIKVAENYSYIYTRVLVGDIGWKCAAFVRDVSGCVGVNLTDVGQQDQL
ncbi:hypothetical protein BaRGS_00038248 [Batillaria attramentaria]|uniref:Uncharacterized protein n=1 Tax=Batillaria attramentaria TaxID=370345 RepID=A0ABD0J6B2_9CAEN